MVTSGGSTSVSAWIQEYGPKYIDRLGVGTAKKGTKNRGHRKKTPAGDNDGGRKVKGIREDAE
jgi:hypothetical protein